MRVIQVIHAIFNCSDGKRACFLQVFLPSINKRDWEKGRTSDWNKEHRERERARKWSVCYLFDVYNISINTLSKYLNITPLQLFLIRQYCNWNFITSSSSSSSSFALCVYILRARERESVLLLLLVLKFSSFSSSAFFHSYTKNENGSSRILIQQDTLYVQCVQSVECPWGIAKQQRKKWTNDRINSPSHLKRMFN